MNVLIFIHSLSSGGAERVTANLANNWAAKGWTVSVVTLTGCATDFYELHPLVRRVGMGVDSSSSNAITALVNNARRIFALRRVLVELKPDVAIGMMTTASILLCIAASFKSGTQVIGSEHVHPPFSAVGRFWTFMRRYWYGRLSTVTALTPESAQWLFEHTRAKHVAVIPNSVCWPLPVQAPFIVPPQKHPSGLKILLAVGRLSHEKGFDILIEVFADLAHEHPEWQLMILGEGPLRRELTQQIHQAGLESRIALCGLAGNVRDWYRAADLYVMSSRFEGFGNTLIEAMAHGVPAVSFDCETGPRNIIEHGVNGMLVENGNRRALRDCLHNLMANDGARVALGADSAVVLERFSVAQVSAMWEELFASSKQAN